jgi:NAD(P)-dependent dehydrogenase (short-subunit alcohol dehydrogenase family)
VTGEGPGRTEAPVAVVTGAGSGIGRAVTRRLLTAGFRVALVGRTRSALEATAAPAVTAPGGTALVLPADVTVDAEVAALVATVERTWGRLDLLVNNAGTFGPVGAVDEIDPAEFRATVEVNLTGAFLCTHHAVRVMKRQRPRGGRIINNGSISAHVPRPRSVAYAASKHAMTGLTRATALDGRAHDITCGQLDIGNARTEMTTGFTAEPTFDVAHVADAVLAVARLPLGVSVPTMTIVATGMPYGGRG